MWAGLFLFPGFEPGLYKMEKGAVHSAPDCEFDVSSCLKLPLP